MIDISLIVLSSYNIRQTQFPILLVDHEIWGEQMFLSDFPCISTKIHVDCINHRIHTKVFKEEIFTNFEHNCCDSCL